MIYSILVTNISNIHMQIAGCPTAKFPWANCGTRQGRQKPPGNGDQDPMEKALHTFPILVKLPSITQA